MASGCAITSLGDWSRKHPDAWRLPAPSLERGIARSVHSHLSDPAILPKLFGDLKATDVPQLKGAMSALIETVASHQRPSAWCDLLSCATITPGKLVVELHDQAIAECLAATLDRINTDHLRIEAPYQLRRRGVETKIILGGEPAEVDEVLIRNIVKAMTWYDAIKSGETFAEIALQDGTSKRRIQDVVDLAFLSPDVLHRAVAGTLPPHVTSDLLVKQSVPTCWSDQQALIAENPAHSNAA
jgi:site-specific DNA recombinase